MTIRFLPAALRRSLLRTSALTTGALVCLTGTAACAEPTPPVRQPAYTSSLLDRPGTQVRPGSAAPPLPAGVSALSWVVADARTGEVLAARDAHRRLPPASTLKSLFALAALPRLHPDTRHTVTEAELARVGGGSSLVGVSAGRSYRVADLWRGVFLSSGNDAVHVLAAMNGGMDRTVRQMRAKARALGARDTQVVSPDGYDAMGQVSSAYDLAVFGRAGLADPQFARYCSTTVASFPAGGWSYPIQNTNRLLTGADGVARYPGLIGVKNGYTSQAGNTLIAAAHRGARTLVVTVMNPQNGGYAVYEEARRLLDWGFAAAGRVRPVGSLLPAKPRTAPDRARHAAAAAPAFAPEPDTDADDDSAWPALVLVGAGAAVLVAGCVVIVRRRAATVARRSGTGGEFVE
ncbi:D-alanyl-D-alanine carboxypeptidase family protein [Streptomyces sp. MNP-20]|uniref:D-alanyl-D-alanine carboxypeptidase family protein n=1 Tax=Streptomyces sp. MNP-20 TaxID=2721165 RepID=UPI001554ADC0|nr:serine hydrolase [Streptomyces sp. MNP-20]